MHNVSGEKLTIYLYELYNFVIILLMLGDDVIKSHDLLLVILKGSLLLLPGFSFYNY